MAVGRTGGGAVGRSGPRLFGRAGAGAATGDGLTSGAAVSVAILASI